MKNHIPNTHRFNMELVHRNSAFCRPLGVFPSLNYGQRWLQLRIHQINIQCHLQQQTVRRGAQTTWTHPQVGQTIQVTPQKREENEECRQQGAFKEQMHPLQEPIVRNSNAGSPIALTRMNACGTKMQRILFQIHLWQAWGGFQATPTCLWRKRAGMQKMRIWRANDGAWGRRMLRGMMIMMGGSR